MRVINLTHGAGDGVKTACLMTASNLLIGRGADGDRNSCVCPVIRAFILRTNDAMPEELLAELYGPLTWEILGTRNDDQDVLMRRARAFSDWAQQFAAADAAAADAAAADAAAADASAFAAAFAADAAAFAAAFAADAAAAFAETIWRKCPEIIRIVAAIGDKRPKEPECVITRAELCEALG